MSAPPDTLESPTGGKPPNTTRICDVPLHADTQLTRRDVSQETQPLLAHKQDHSCSHNPCNASTITEKQPVEVSKTRADQKVSELCSCFPYPLSIVPLLIYIFFQAFAYYGLTAILVLFFRDHLGYSESYSVAFVHYFISATFFFSVPGKPFPSFLTLQALPLTTTVFPHQGVWFLTRLESTGLLWVPYFCGYWETRESQQSHGQIWQIGTICPTSSSLRCSLSPLEKVCSLCHSICMYPLPAAPHPIMCVARPNQHSRFQMYIGCVCLFALSNSKASRHHPTLVF